MEAAFAHLNLSRHNGPTLRLPTEQQDSPLGASRYVQRASGYDATIVNGEVFMARGEHTGALSGVTLRS